MIMVNSIMPMAYTTIPAFTLPSGMMWLTRSEITSPTPAAVKTEPRQATGLGIGLSALNGVALGVLVAIILLMIMNRDNKPSTFLNDSERMLSTVGPLSMLPMLLGVNAEDLARVSTAKSR